MSHTPSADGPPAHDLTAQGEWTLPADIYARPERYTSRPECLNETMLQLERVRNDPDGTLTIYRACHVGVTTIEAGAWVTLSRDYAHVHAGQLPHAAHAVAAVVRACEVRHAGDDLAEFGYWPEG